VANATAVIFKMLLLAQGRFRTLNAPERMKQVFLGVQFKDGIEVRQEGVQELAA
jgi:putative transposase